MKSASLEDCLEHIPSRFDLCLIATKRARQLARGAPSDIPAGEHKSTVQSLMEISRGIVGRDVLLEADLPKVEMPSARFDALDPYFDA
jgi:DNA-directed RNA polymerase subunit omega